MRGTALTQSGPGLEAAEAQRPWFQIWLDRVFAVLRLSIFSNTGLLCTRGEKTNFLFKPRSKKKLSNQIGGRNYSCSLKSDRHGRHDELSLLFLTRITM